MNDNRPKDEIWPPPIHRVEGKSVQSDTEEVKLSANDRFIARGRWLVTVTIVYNLLGFLWQSTEHIYHWWHLGTLGFLPLAIKAWKLRYKQR